MSSRDWHDPPQDALYRQKNIFDELTTRELQIVWEHSIAKVPPSEGITTKFFDYSAGVTRDGPSAVVGEGEYIQTKEYGDYGGGQPVIAGCTFEIDQQPTGDQDAWTGYYDTDDGDGVGLGVREFTTSEGTPNATETGVQPYVWFERFGNTRTEVPQEHWNINTCLPADADEGPPLDLTDGITVRMPHACYFHSKADVEVGVKLDSGGFALVPVHEFNHQGGPMWSHSDLRIRTEVSGTEGNGFAAKLTTVHYEGEQGRAVKRVTGEAWTPQKDSGNVLPLNTYPNWTYVMGFARRSGWERIDLTPLHLALNTTADVEAQITVGGSFSGTDFTGRFPEDIPDSERGVNYDLNRPNAGTETTIDSIGQREWIDFVPGDKQDPISLDAALEDVTLGATDIVALLVRPATGTATELNGASLANGAGF